MSISFTPKGLLNYALNNYRKDKNRNKLAAEINSEIFQSIEWLEDFPLFKKKLTNILVINVSFIFLLSNMIRDLDISHALANQTSIYLRERYYSEWYINKSAGKSAKIIKKKFGLVRNLLRSEFSIATSEVYKDDKYISRFVEHIMLIVFSVPYDKSLYDALIRTYKNVCELQRAYDELSKTLTESDDVYTTTAEAHTPTTGTPQSTISLPQKPQPKPLKSDKTFWSMLVIFGVLPLIFVLCLIWYFSCSYESPANTNNNGVETTASSFQDGKPKSYKSTKSEATQTTEANKDYSKALEEMRRRQKENPDKYTAPEGFADSFLASLQTSQPQPKNESSAAFIIDFTYDVIDSNHVGNSWSCDYNIDGDALCVGDTVSVSLGSVMRISATAAENDNSKDVGESSITRTISKNDIENGFSTTFNVYVKENRGRYAGNTATVRVKLTFTPKH